MRPTCATGAKMLASESSAGAQRGGFRHPRQDLPNGEKLRAARRCSREPAYFLKHFAYIEVVDEDGEGGSWQPFELWPAQAELVEQWKRSRLLLVPKARQLGVTWLFLGLKLWKMLFRPGSKVGLWSRRETEAIHLLQHRLKGMYKRLPSWLKVKEVTKDSMKEWVLSNGSAAMAFPTSAGDSYTFSDGLVDEGDLAPDLARMLEAVKPTIDAGGSLSIVSKMDKAKPQSTMKRLCRRAVENPTVSPWRVHFLPWQSRPGRDGAWYEAQRQHSLDTDGTLDYLHANYPATLAEALAPSEADKRIPAAWLQACYEPREPLDAHTLPQDAPTVPGIRIYHFPGEGRRYVVGADPAQGLQTGDDSAAVVLDEQTGEEVASWEGKHEPKESFPAQIAQVCRWYNNAAVMPLSNNHGHALIGGLKRYRVRVLKGNRNAPGWVESTKGKAELYDELAGEARATWQTRKHTPDASGLTIHSARVYFQVASIDANTLNAPPGEHDDCADALAAANIGRPRVAFEHRFDDDVTQGHADDDEPALYESLEDFQGAGLWASLPATFNDDDMGF